ncbi:MAG TPA: hypothetical protein VMB80_10105 [Candidatus Acidoferrum sp.]|nr:hypothetical protein [Candidatus Acidoferrum sp.]
MKRWAVLTVLLYALALLLLTVPVVWLAYNGWSGKSVSLSTELKIFRRLSYWLWLLVLVAGQFLLLLLPIHIAERRRPARRPLTVTVIVTGLFLGNLCFAGLLSILMLYFQEDGLDFFGYFLPFKENQVAPSIASAEFGAVITLLACWAIWAVIFRSFAKADAPDALLKRGLRWLLRGSILELLVAVPSHVIVRRREDCCAHFGTFWGIASGFSVMLLCFGPGVFFLFVERCRRLQPKSSAADPTPVAK